MEYVIAATLSSFKTETWFYSKKGEGLRERLEELYDGVDNPFIKGNRFRDSIFPRNDFVRFNLSAYTIYGQRIGLTNWGLDYEYYIDPKLKDIRDSFLDEAKDVLGEKDFNFFKELGKGLISN